MNGCSSCFNIFNPLPSDGQFSHPQELSLKQTFMNAGQVPILKKKYSTVAVLISISLSAIL